MTLNEFIAELKALRDAGHGDCTVIGQMDYYDGSGSLVYADAVSASVIDVRDDPTGPVATGLIGKKAILIYP